MIKFKLKTDIKRETVACFNLSETLVMEQDIELYYKYNRTPDSNLKNEEVEGNKVWYIDKNGVLYPQKIIDMYYDKVMLNMDEAENPQKSRH